MTVESAADLAQFFSSADFAEAVTYNGATINVIFGSAYIEIDSGNIGFQSAAPAIIAMTSDVPSAAHGDTVVIGATTYKVVGVEPDSTGVTQLRLEKQ